MAVNSIPVENAMKFLAGLFLALAVAITPLSAQAITSTVTANHTTMNAPDWNSAVTYTPGMIVKYGNRWYTNWRTTNLNQNPATVAGAWELLSDTSPPPVFSVDRTVQGGRLSLHATDPEDDTVTTSTTIYYLPYYNNYVGLWRPVDGWLVCSFGAGKSITNAGLLANRVYDVWAETDSVGNVSLRLTVWANDTTRNVTSPIGRFEGVMVRDPATNLDGKEYRYIGSVRTNASSQFVNSQTERWTYNFDNAIPTQMYTSIGPMAHTYNSSTIRKLNNTDADSTVTVLIGLPNNRRISGDVGVFGYSGAGGDYHVGLDISTNPALSGVTPINASLVQTSTAQVTRVNAEQKRLPQGLNYLRIVEYAYAGTGFSQYAGHNLSIDL